MTNVLLALGLIMIASIANAGFALPMRFNRAWKYENTWLVFTVCALTVVPWILTLSLVNHLPELLSSLTLKDLAPALVFGFLWGIAMATYGLALALLGISVAVPIVAGFTIIIGSFTPIVARHPALLFERPGIIMEFSAALLIGSLLLYGKAARMREGPSSANKSTLGLILALFTGVFGGLINVGFALSDKIIQRSQMLGNSASFSTYPVWAFLLTSALIPNLIYCFYLLFTKDTGKLFFAPGAWWDFIRSILMGGLWIMATVFYGMSTTFLGKLGTSVGFLLYGAISICCANVIGWKAGEWTGASSLIMKIFWAAMGLAIASIAILGMAG
jgi:L-rhamnose-H+ transport protein